eukprot:COSAG04_NODE_24405_length_322_cov_1.085202_2_plen_32_part_01
MRWVALSRQTTEASPESLNVPSTATRPPPVSA